MRICAYRGYATPAQIFVSGRVLANQAPAGLTERESFWRNLLNTYRQFETDEVRHVRVTLRFEDQEHAAETDAEGYYEMALSRTEQRGETWLKLEARCTVRGEEITATHEILAPTRDAEFGIISDLDDTVIETNMTRLLTAAKLTFAGNAKSRKPLEGVAALYASLAAGRAGRLVNPIFYVSSSPWNLYDLLCDFMALNEIPKGPIFLRDWGIDRTKFIKPRGHRDKLEHALKIMADFPDLQFILVGDSGQQDASLYAEATTLCPGRIKAIYIRDVDPASASKRDDDVSAQIKIAALHGVPMLLAPDSQAMAHHAAELGLIPARREAEVQLEVAKDHERPNPGAAAVGAAMGIGTSSAT